jgi:RNA polymerase primary sigma factor
MAGKVLTGKDIERILMIAQDVMSLNMPVSNDPDSEAELNDYIEDTSPTPYELVVAADRKEFLLKQMRKCLSPRECTIITLRFGLESGNSMTLEEIGKELKITRERVRQLEEKALRKLRHYFLKQNLTREDV